MALLVSRQSSQTAIVGSSLPVRMIMIVFLMWGTTVFFYSVS
jgi:hypothetical protein